MKYVVYYVVGLLILSAAPALIMGVLWHNLTKKYCSQTACSRSGFPKKAFDVFKDHVVRMNPLQNIF